MSDLSPETPQPEGQLQKREPNPRRVAHAGNGRICPQAVKDAVIDRMREGMGIRASMALSGYHMAEIYDWIREDLDYGARFKTAKEALAHHYAEESVDLLDKGSVEDVEDPKRASAHANLLQARSRARQWLAGKWLPGEYGEKIEYRGTITNAVVLLPPLDPLPAQATARMLPLNRTASLASSEAVVIPEGGEG